MASRQGLSPTSATLCHTPRPSKPARTRDPGHDSPMPQPSPPPTSAYATPAQDVARWILGEDVTQFDFYAGPNGLDVIRIVAGEALGLALMATRFSRRRRGCQTIANPDGISAAVKDGVDIDR